MSATSIGQIGLDLVVNQKPFNKQMNGIEKIAKKTGAALASAFAVKKVVEFGKACVDLGSDLEEVQNVVEVTFPKMAEQVNKFSKSAAGAYGLSETMAKKFTGTFGAMAKAFGFTEQQAYDMSTTLTGLAGDVASFYNLTQDEAYTKLKSVFTGETESLKDLGVVMTQASLDSYALANGFGKTTKAMSEAEKVALRYSFVQNQLAAATGDFARTSDSWANQTRILSLRFESLKASIGSGLIAAFTPIIRIINTVLAKLQVLADAFATFMKSIFGDSSESSGLEQVANAAGSAASAYDSIANNAASTAESAKKTSKFLAGFDAITKVSNNSSSSVGGSAGAGGTSIAPSVDLPDTNKIGESTSGIIGKFKEVIRFFEDEFIPIFEPIWNRFRDDWLPIFEEFAYEVNETAKVLWDNLSEGLTILWEEVINPVLESITEVTTDLMDILKRFWDEYAGPIFEKLREAVQSTSDTISKVWNEIIHPILEKAMDTTDELWEEHLLPLFDDISELIGEFILGALDIYNKFILPMVNWFIELLSPAIKDSFDEAMEEFSKFVEDVTEVGNIVKDALKGIIFFLTGVFTGDWKKALDGLKMIFKEVFDSFVFIARKPINIVIGIINGMIQGVVKGINTAIRSINALSFKIPDWVPDVGGKKIGFNLKQVSAPIIPRLAQGGYVKPNTPQLAMIGDNLHQGEVVAPENKLAEMARAAASAGSDRTLLLKIISLMEKLIMLIEEGDDIIFMVDGEELARAVQNGTLKLKRRFSTVEVTL